MLGKNEPGGQSCRPALRVGALSLAAVLAIAAVPMATAVAAPGDFAYGTVIVDANQNGVIDDPAGLAGEADLPLAGVEVTLRGADGTIAATTTTAADGTWAFPAGDYSANPGPYTVTIDTDGVNADAYGTYEESSDNNDFARSGGAQTAISAPFPGDGNTVLDALVYPTWSLDLALAADPDGYEGNSVYTGTGPFDDDDSQPGSDASQSNGRVRSADIVSYNWSLTAANQDALGSTFGDTIFEQTIQLESGAVANFTSVPAICESGFITAQPSGTEIDALVDPPAGTTEVVLTCNLGDMGENRQAILMPTSVQVSANSANGSEISTEVRAYAVDDDGVATARPSNTFENGPIEITSSPRYDLEKLQGGTNYLGFRQIDGERVRGLYTYYTIQISTDRRAGVEAFEQPITFEESFIPRRSVEGPNGEAPGTFIEGMSWYIDLCDDSPYSSQGVYGRIGRTTNATVANSVPDSGDCSYTRTGDPETGNYTFTLANVDTSGSSYPTQTAAGASLAAGPYYVASKRIRVFIPFSEIDATEGEPDDGVGEVSLFNRVGNFDPNGISGASNFGEDLEPGYCPSEPNTEGVENCEAMEGEGDNRSNNVAGPKTLRISKGSWGKYLVDKTSAWTTSAVRLPEMGSTHDGAAQVQPGQTFSSRQILNNGGVDMDEVQMCDVFDNTVLRLAPLDQDTVTGTWGSDVYSAVIWRKEGSTPNAATQQDYQAQWVTKYAHVDLGTDDPNNGTLDLTTNRFEGDWTNQRAATNGAGTVCGSSDLTWYDSPSDVPGGIDAVNVVWTQLGEGSVLAGGDSVYWFLSMEQRDAYNGGPHAGEQIPAGTIAANYGNVKTSTYGENWLSSRYVPGAGTTSGQTNTGETGSAQGDRWTVVRARMALQKRTVAGDVNGTPATGVADFETTGAARAGRPVIWEITSTLTAVSDDPAAVNDVIITDTLPASVSYNLGATEELDGGTPATTAVVNPDGTTTLTWNLGTRVPNQDLPVLKVVTDTDSLAPNNTVLINEAEITASGVAPARSHSDDHTIRLEQSGEIQLKKSVDRTLDLQNDTQAYTLQLKNFSQTLSIQAPTIIDVLPYNGDSTNTASVNRSPASDLTGENVLAGEPQAFEFDGSTPLDGTFYYTTADPTTVPQDLSDDVPALWSTTYTPDATAFKFVAENSLSTASDASGSGLVIRVTTNQVGNSAGDLYSNRFTAFSDTLKNGDRFQILPSNLVTVRVLGFSLGDLIWLDVNGDGVFTQGTDRTAPAGVEVEVYDGSDARVGSTLTDDDGRWVLNNLPAGTYYAVIPGSQFDTGGPLAGYMSAPGAQVDPNTDLNEDQDHHTIPNAGGGVRTSGLIELSADTAADPLAGQEPVGDNVADVSVAPLTTDDFTNLTLDMALVPPATFSVSKIVNGDAADYAVLPFTVEVTCSYMDAAVAGFPKNLTFEGAGSQELMAPLGSVCSATETETGSASVVTVTPAEGITLEAESSEDQALSVTNTYDTSGLVINKEVTGAGAADFGGGPFTYSVECTFNGKAVPSQSVTIPEGDFTNGAVTSEAVTGLPVGASCVVSETDDGGADFTPEPVTVTVVADENVTVAFTGEMSNVFSSGTVGVEKVLVGDAADEPWATTPLFGINVTCQREVPGEDGEPVLATVFSQLVSIQGGDSVDTLVDADGNAVKLPVGTRCFGEETATAGATTSTVVPDSYETASAVVASEDSSEVQELKITATNTFEYAEIELKKDVIGDAAAFAADTEFTLDVSCVLPQGGTDTTIVDAQSYTIKGGETVTVGELPVGANCWAEESVDGGATVVAVSNGSREEAVVADGSETPVAITVTNTFEAGGLVINKDVTGSGSPEFAQGPFTYSVECSFNGTVLDARTVTIGEGDGSQVSFTSEAITGLPAGARCVVSETENGGADFTPDPINITVAAGTNVLVGFTGEMSNKFSSGTVGVSKSLAGAAAGEDWATESTFLVDVMCQREIAGEGGEMMLATVFSRTVAIKGGESIAALTDGDENPVKLPVGTRCFGEEIETSGATSAVVTPSTYADAAAVVATEDPSAVQALMIEAVNTFEYGSIELKKDVVGDAAGYVGDREFTLAVSCVLPQAGEDTVLIDGEEFTFTADEGFAIDELPVGALCWAEETDDGGATEVSISHSDRASAALVGSDDGEAVAVTVTNTFDAANITVGKTVVNGSPGPYSFALSCSTEQGAVALAAGDATFILTDGEVRTVSVPVGATCQVTEAAVEGATVSFEDSDGTNDGNLVLTEDGSVQVTNTFPDEPVDPPKPNLPNAGGPTLGLLILGIAGILGGAALLIKRRNRA